MFGTFAENSLADLNDAQLEQFEGLLDCSDADFIQLDNHPECTAANIRP